MVVPVEQTGTLTPRRIALGVRLVVDSLLHSLAVTTLWTDDLLSASSLLCCIVVCPAVEEEEEEELTIKFMVDVVVQGSIGESV